MDLVDGMLPLFLDPIYGSVCVTFPKINNKIDLSGNFWNGIDYKKISHFEMLVKKSDQRECDWPVAQYAPPNLKS